MDARALKDKATQLFSKGKFAKAAEAYDEYCKADLKDLQARLRLGDAWLKAGKKEKAVLAYTWAAEGFARDGFLPRAIAASKLVLEVDPTHTGVQKMLADLYAQKTRPAARSTSTGIRAAPGPTPAPASGDGRALDLVAPTPAAAVQANPAGPSPTNRADAIEVEAFEVPIDDGRSGIGGMAAARGPSPLTRADAIEIEVAPEAPKERDPGEMAPIEIELGAAGPVTGEVEIPIEAGALQAADQLPAELQVPVVAGAELREPPVVQGTSLSPAPVRAPDLEVPESSPSGPVYDLDVEVPDPPPSAPVYELDVEVPQPPSPPADTLDVGPPGPAAAATAPPGVEVAGQAPATPVYELDVEAPPDEPVPAVPAVSASEVLPPVRVAPVPAPAAIPAAPLPPPAPKAPADDELLAATRPEVHVPPAPPEVIPAPSPRPVEAGAPPGLKPRKGDTAAPAAPSPAASRIWLPPGFGPGAVGDGAPTTARAAATPSADAATDLERSLQAFSQFDADAAPPAPAAPTTAKPAASFTELELKGDSLLHAVDVAAHRGLSERGAVAPAAAASAEEAMEAPDEPRVEPGALPKIPLFSDLPHDAFIALFENCPLRRFEPGDTVIEQGTRGDAFYVICAGAVRVVRVDGEARRELAKLDEGAFFGEMALLSDAPRSASVEAVDEDTQLLEIGAGILKDLSAKHPSVATALKKFCRQRMLSNLMQSAALFRPFSRSDRRDLVQRFRAREVPRGEALIKEGQASDGLYVVLSGEVDVVVKGRKVASLKEGEVFGEMSLLTRSAATATVVTARHTSLLRLPREDFDRLILSHPQILEHVSELTDERAKANAAAQMV